jgi:membrane associated rhomboid family serine protease
MIPYHVDVYKHYSPVVNMLLVAAITMISLAGLAEYHNSGSTDMIESGMAFPLIGSAFFHVGLWHLVGNMLFLWVFGNALNSKVGNLIYPIFFFVVAAMSDVIHLAADGRPAIGASGAIMGVVGAYLFFFPRNECESFFLFLIKPIFFCMSSMWLIFYYVGWDLWFIVTGMESNVAVWAHFGGFVSGLGIAIGLYYLRWVPEEETEENLFQTMGIIK